MKNKTLNIIIFILIILFGGYYIYNEYPQIVFFNKNSEEMPTKTGAKKEPEIVEKEPKLTTKEELEIAIEEAIITKRGNYGGLNITVSEIIDDTYAKGGAAPTGGGPGGGMWFAKKVGDEWKLVWDGNGAIYCEDLEGYEDFPIKLISECYDKDTTQVITR